MVVAQAFVPINSLDDVFDTLQEHIAENYPELGRVLDWFETYYLGPRGRNGARRQALFPKEMWNVYDRVINNNDRTNNYCEAAHRRLHKQLCMDHPSIWKFIGGIKQIQKGKDKNYEEMVAGAPPAAKRRPVQRVNERVREIVLGGLAARTHLEYLGGLANCFNMDK